MCAQLQLIPTPLPAGPPLTQSPEPFALEFVSITKQEHIELKLAALQWRGLHRKAVSRCEQQEARHYRLVRELKAQALKSKAGVRAKVEHPFRVIKRQFGFVKVRYRGLKKNTQHLFTLFALSNLWMVRGKLMQM